MSEDTNNENNLLALNEQETQLATTLDRLSASGIACRDMKHNFSKVMLSARCMQELREALTPQMMKPIMALQGSPLGFRTDKDKMGGYGENIVKEAVIAAAMLGLMPIGNQFNIIADRPYWTKEGFMYLLSQINGLVYDVDFGLPKASNGGSVVHTKVVWSINGGEQKCMEWDIPIRVNAGQGADAVLGKAMRKACAKLYNKVTNSTLSDADVTEDEPRNVTPMRWSGDKVQNAAAPMRASVPSMKPSVPADVPNDKVVDAEVVDDTQQATDAAPVYADGDEEQQEQAAFIWLNGSVKSSGATWTKVYKVMDALGFNHPGVGAAKPELAKFSLWVFRTPEAREALEQSGFVFEK